MGTADRPGGRAPIGIFTTDDRLVVRAWDPWLADATGIPSEAAVNRALTDLLPDLHARGLLAKFENVLARGTVEVLAPALHRYLIACAPREPETGFAEMQQHVTIGPLRDDSRIVGLIVSVEDVTVRMAMERRLAVQMQADSSSGAPRQIEALTRLLAEEDWRHRRTAVATLAGHGDAVVDALIGMLRTEHRNLSVLSSALDLLAVSDIDVVGPLVEFLDDADPNLRIQAALILGERRDGRAVRPLIAKLSDPDTNVQFHVIEALGRLHATEACDALLSIAEQRDFFLSFPALHALSRAGNPTIAPRLVPLLDDDLLRAPVIELLGELGDDEVTAPLVQLLNTSGAPPDVIADALAGLYERYESRYGAGEHIADLVRRAVTAPGVQSLLDAVQQVGSDRLPNLAKVLSWFQGEAVQRALTRLLGHTAVRAQVVEALVRHGGGVVSLLIEQLRSEDLEIRQAAAVALGRIGERQATPALVAALQDPELALAAAGALARIGDRDAFEGLLGLLGDPASATRQAAVAALNSIGHPEMPHRVAHLLEHESPLVRESALRIAGYFGYAECIDHVLRCVHDDSETVRRTAVESLAMFEDPRAVPAVIDALRRDVPAVRAAAASTLARVEDRAAVDALAAALDDSDAWVRFMAVRALGASGEARVVPPVMRTLRHDPAPHVRLAAIDVLGRLRPPDALEVLPSLAESSDGDMSRAAIRALGHIDHPDALPLLEGFLRSPDPWRRMAAVAAVTVRAGDRVADLLQWVAAADESPDVANAAVDGLQTAARRADSHGAAATRALIALTAEAARREAAIAALSTLPARRIEEVAAGLRHPAPEVRRATVEALGRMKHPDASRALVSTLDDPDAGVRLAAIRELKHLGTRAPLRKLTTMARTDADAEVRRAALLAAARTTDFDPDAATVG